MIPKNTLLEDVETKDVFRVLDEIPSPDTNDSAAVLFVLIKLNDKKLNLQLVGKSKIMERIADRSLVAKEEIRAPINMDALSKAEATIVERRRSLIDQVALFGRKLFIPSIRGQLAREFDTNGKASRPYFYKTLRLWWQGGGVVSGLVTEFPNCGRKGERRVHETVAKKPGRPRTVQPGVGLAITIFHLQNMRVAWSRSPVGGDGRNLRSAYTWMLQARYYDELELTPPKLPSRRVISAATSNSVKDAPPAGEPLVPRVKNYDRVPSFEQFRYHWQAEFAYSVRKLNRLQKRRFEQAFKPLLSGIQKELRGPGTRYYIDATVLDVYCVSRLNPNRIVGRPTLYIVIDGFSRMIVGIYVGLEPPCWAGAMLALWNCNLDKVQFCAHYGIEIEADAWPTGFMPLHLLGDRGELASHQAEVLVVAFNLDVENSRAYAGEAKGVVERAFNTTQAKFGPFIPGYVDKEFSGRDATPAELRAAMNILEITRVVIGAVLHTNLRVVRDYEGWPEMIADGTPFVPVSLWHWGVENLRSDVRQFDQAYLTKNLWPSATMKFNRNALKFYRGMYFMGVRLQEEPWFAKAFFDREEVSTRFNPIDVSSAILIPPNHRSGQIDLALTRRSARFSGFALSEVTALTNDAKRRNAEAAWENLPRQVELERNMHADRKQAKRNWRDQYDDSISNAARRRGIKENRRDELASMTAESVGLTTPSESNPPTSTEANNPYQVAVQETADEVERLLNGGVGSGGGGQ